MSSFSQSVPHSNSSYWPQATHFKIIHVPSFPISIYFPCFTTMQYTRHYCSIMHTYFHLYRYLSLPPCFFEAPETFVPSPSLRFHPSIRTKTHSYVWHLKQFSSFILSLFNRAFNPPYSQDLHFQNLAFIHIALQRSLSTHNSHFIFHPR